MGKYFKSLLNYMWSDKAVQHLYDHSRPENLERGARNYTSITICTAMLFCLILFVGALSLRSQNVRDFLETQPDVAILDKTQAQYRLYPVSGNCDVPFDCVIQARQAGSRSITLTKDTFTSEEEEVLPQGGWVVVEADYNLSQTDLNWTGMGTRFSFYRMKYQRGHLFVDGQKHSEFFDSDHISLELPTSSVRGRSVRFHFVMKMPDSYRGRLVRYNLPAFVSSHDSYRQLENFQQERRLNPHRQVSTVARIVMGLLIILLFLVIDSSPETLGLAMFMGLEAVAMALGNGDLRRLWIPMDMHDDLIGVIHYCHAMGDIFRLYFVMQLARVAKPSISKWLIIGSLYAIPYAYLRHVQWDPGWNWSREMILYRDFTVAFLGILIVTRKAWFLRAKGLPWRVAALSLAALGCVAQVMWSAPYIFPPLETFVRSIDNFGNLISIVNANSAYVFALSAFINISTLENRVKVLTKEKVRADAIQRDLELGQRVQQAFLEMPKMPKEIGLSCHHEAAVYVSGDTYFVHWDEKNRVLTFLINDVTGHGIQAALKAFACNIIARSVWGDESVANDRRRSILKLQRYDDAVCDLICRDGDVPDFNAMVGAEFEMETGKARLYRVNYNFPILVEPEFNYEEGKPDQALGVNWQAKQLTVPNKKEFEIDLKEGAFIMMVSDGLIETGRDQRNFLGYINRYLAKAPADLDCHELRHRSLQWEGLGADRKSDDKTLLIFQWNPYAKSQKGFRDRRQGKNAPVNLVSAS